MFAIAQKSSDLSEFGQKFYGLINAASRLAALNNISKTEKVRVNQRIRLEYLEGFNNEKYKLLMKKSFLVGELSYADLYRNHIFYSDFTDIERKVIKQHLMDMEIINQEKKKEEKELKSKFQVTKNKKQELTNWENKYKKELERIDEYFCEDFRGNVIALTTELSNSMEIFGSWKKGLGLSFQGPDKTLFGIVDIKTLAGELGVKWSLPGVSYDGVQGRGFNNMGISAKMDFTVASMSGEIPLPWIKLVIGGKVGGGLGVQVGKTPGSKKVFGASAAFGIGLEVNIELRD